MEGGRMAHAKAAKGAGGMPTLKTMKTASRTWKAGGKRLCSRGAGLPPVRLQKSGRQAKTPMISVISRPSWEVRLPSRALAHGGR
jgi:hypothetical protein